MIYLDNSATTRQYDEVTELVYKMARDNYGNPSSLHALGFDAGNILFDARTTIEDLMHPGGDIIFTSGGTESDNMALVSSARKMKRRGKRILTTRVEHPAVLETCRRLADDGFSVDYLSVDSTGYVDPDSVRDALTDDTIIVSIMTVNNETGTIQTVLPVSRAVKEYNRQHGTKIIFHTDAVQAFGKLPMDDAAFDLVSVSGHKFHGPKGVGFLYIKNGIPTHPLVDGGSQEFGYRAGTENVPYIAGFGLAAQIMWKEKEQILSRMQEIKRHLLERLMKEVDGVHVNGPEPEEAAAHILNLRFDGVRSEVLLHALEDYNVYVSSGSACSSNNPSEKSPSLHALGLSAAQMDESIRLSFGRYSTLEDADAFVDAVVKILPMLRRFRRK